MSERKIEMLPISKIRNGLQPRKSSGLGKSKMRGLMQSIEQLGILTPLHVRPEGVDYEVIDGNRRLLAAERIGLEFIPAIIFHEPLDAASITHHQLVIDSQREEFNPIERGRAMKRLIDEANWSSAQVAAKVGVSEGFVSKLLRVLDLSPEMQAQVAAGRLPMSSAYLIACLPDRSAREGLAKLAIEQGLSRDEIVRRCKQITHPRPAGTSQPVSQPRPTTLTLRPRPSQSITYRGPQITRDGMLALLALLAEQVAALAATDGSNADWHQALGSHRRKERGA